MIRLLMVGDPHFRGTSPRNRIDNYWEACRAKWLEIFELARQYEVAAIIQKGDLFDSFSVADSVKQDVADLLNLSPVNIYGTTGSHDVDGYNLEQYRRYSLALLERMVPKLKIITNPQAIFFGDTVVTFQPHTPQVDIDGWGYNPQEGHTAYCHIHVSHGMLIDHEPPFKKFTLIQDVETTADIVSTGHYHPGYGIYRRADGVTFENLGSLTRTSASEPEIRREIQVGLYEIRGKRDYDITPITLKSAKPGDQVLDRSKIEAEKERAYAMDSFSALIQTRTGEKVLLDIPTIVEEIAAQENVAPEVVQAVLKRINEQRGLV